MKIKIDKNLDAYGFRIIEGSKDIFDSTKLYFLSKNVSPYYNYAWEACRDANDFLSKRQYHLEPLKKLAYEDLQKPVAVEMSGEEMISNHYKELLSMVSKRAKGTRNDDKEANIVYKEIKMILDELKQIVTSIESEREKKKLKELMIEFKRVIQNNFKVLPEKIEPEKPAGIENLACRMCQAIERNHPDAIYQIGSSVITIYSNNSAILKATLDKHENLTAIVPMGVVAKTFPYHNPKFYQRYWKPIVEACGKFYIKGHDALLIKSNVVLPDIPRHAKKDKIDVIRLSDGHPTKIVMSFNDNSWQFEKSKTSYLNTIVTCVDSSLPSLVSQTGEVVQVLFDDLQQIDVNFGRGLGIVRLTVPQVEITLDNNG